MKTLGAKVGRIAAAPDRREVVQSLALAAAPLAGPAARPRRLRVAVVGAGIVGASIAYHLAGAGAEVVALEKAAPGAGATQGAFAMLIATHADRGRAFDDLYRMAILDWRRLERELSPRVQLQWGGELAWAPPGPAADALGAAARRLQGWGAAVRLVDPAEMGRLVPGIEPGPVGAASFSADAGAVDPMQALRALVAAARRRGAQFRFPCQVRSIRADGARVVGLTTADGPVDADVVVLAAGADTPTLAAQVGVRTPIDVVSGALAHSRPLPKALGRVLVGPQGSLKQDPDGRIVIGPDYRPGARATDTSSAYGERLLAAAARILPASSGAVLETMSLGYVPIPVDSVPIVGFCRSPANLYVALTMSGITMAPLLGRLAAREIADQVPAGALAPYRPARFG